MDTLFRGGEVFAPSGPRRADLLIRGEKIAEIGNDLSCEGARVIDTAGMLLLPGGIDVHTHLDLDAGIARASDDWYTGTAAAAYGGTTTVVDHPAFGPKGCSVFHQIDIYHDLASGKAVIDYGFHGVIQHIGGTVIDDIEGLIERGIVSSKVYLTYDSMLADGEVIKVLERMKAVGGLTAFHCENHGIVTHYRHAFSKAGKTAPRHHAESRPHTAEAEAVSRVIRLAETVGDVPVYVVHLSTASGLEEIRRGRERGVPVFAETCPQYLLLDESRYDEPDLGGLKYVMSPPLRTPSDSEALWKGLADGTIQTVGTDHCPFMFDVKKKLGAKSFLSCPNGAPGIETRMALLYSEGVAAGRITASRYVEITSTLPARIMGLHPLKGVIAPGSDGDIVVFDPEKKVIISRDMLHENVDYTPYEGRKVTGWPAMTMLRGKIIVEDGVLHADPGSGRFLSRSLPDLSVLEAAG